MNKEYIKRQFTLHKLGIPMSEDVKEYYDYFHNLIDVNNIKESIHDKHPGSIFYILDNEIIFEYNIVLKILTKYLWAY